MAGTVPYFCLPCHFCIRTVKLYIVANDIFQVLPTSEEFVYIHLQGKMMEDEQLIELVRGHTILYDLSNAKYMDTNFKQAIWKKIGKEMKADGRL